jgi:hypothetical protein
LPIAFNFKGSMAGRARSFVLDSGLARVAHTEAIGDTRNALGGIPELRRRRASENRIGRDLPTGDERENRFERAAGSMRLLLIAYEPRPHGVLGRLSRERIKQAIARDAARLIGRRTTAIRAGEERKRRIGGRGGWRVIGHRGLSAEIGHAVRVRRRRSE